MERTVGVPGKRYLLRMNFRGHLFVRMRMFRSEGRFLVRRLVFVLGVAGVLAVSAKPVDAQLKFAPHVAMVSSFADAIDNTLGLNGKFGAGARLGLEVPMFPIGVYAMGTYFFTDDAEVSYYTASVMGKLGVPVPVISPYLLGGYQRSATSLGGLERLENVGFVGLGVQISRLFLEGSVEFIEDDPSLPDLDNDPIVFKAGFIIG
ncbi:MAG: hypothetical protein OSA81_10620 [Longimicrobiales bacterium]|nr:hypothetical protein [Longimicrobiales bacterium]